MKDTYLESAQQEVFTEAKNPQYFAPGLSFYDKIKKEMTAVYDLFAKTVAEEYTVVNPKAVAILAEKYVLKEIKDAISGLHDSDNFANLYNEFHEECRRKKWIKDK